jgi:hypothetical protein
MRVVDGCDALHLADANELHAHIITAIQLVCKVDQFPGYVWKCRAAADHLSDRVGVHRPVQAVGAQQQHVAGNDLVVAGFHRHNHGRPQRPAQHVARFGAGGFARRDQAQAHVLVHHRVIARERLGVAMPDAVAARIPDVRNYHPVIAERAGNQRGGHVGPARAAGHAGFENPCVSLLHQPRQQRGMRNASRRAPEILEHGFYRQFGSDFSIVAAAHAIRQREQIT